ncbi:MAG: phage tail tube protein [Armatimonadota bacterium]|nr:phage tail tube protein [Armatimonadota bacterium]
MAGPYGMRGYVGLGKQSAWGTPVAASAFLPALSVGGNALVIDRFETANVVGGVLEPDDMAGAQRVEMEAVLPINLLTIGHVLNAALGESSRSVTVVASGVLWTTTWAAAPADALTQAPLPAYTWHALYDSVANQVHRVRDSQVSRVTIGVAANQAAQATVALVGRSADTTAAVNPTYPASPGAPADFSVCSVSLGGAAVDADALTVTLETPIEPVYALGSQLPVSFVRRGPVQARVALTATLARSEWLVFQNQVERALLVTWTQPASFQLALRFPRVVWTAYPLSIPGRERLVVQAEGKVLNNPTSAWVAALTTIQSAW